MLSTSDAQVVNCMFSPETLSTDLDYGEYFMHLQALSILNVPPSSARKFRNCGPALGGSADSMEPTPPRHGSCAGKFV